MAEILAIIAFPVAVAGTVEAFIRYGKALREQIEKYQNAPKLVIEIQLFAEDLEKGDLEQQIRTVSWMFDQKDVNESVKNKISNLLKKLKAELLTIDTYLANSFDGQNRLNRVAFLRKWSKKLEESMNEIEKWKTSFWREVSIIDMMRRNIPDPLHLTKNIFAPQADEYCKPTKAGSLKQGIAEFKDSGEIRQVRVLVEVTECDSKEDLPEVQKLAVELAGTLWKANRGILRCLGYRLEPVELIFEFPASFENPVSLRQYLLSTGAEANSSLDYRFRIAREIQESIFSVHSAGYVHKNIRPDTIVIFSNSDQQPDRTQTLLDESNLSHAFLTDWSMLRGPDQLSHKRGDKSWFRNFYRHHQRQGMKPQDRYEMKHDIYSLGVCLLEIGVWQSFIIETEDGQVLSEFFLGKAVEYQLAEPSTFNNLESLCASTLLTPIFVGLAKRLLPQRMGLAFTNLVIACLTNVEGGFGDATAFEGDRVVAGLNFKALVLEASPQLSTNIP